MWWLEWWHGLYQWWFSITLKELYEELTNVLSVGLSMTWITLSPSWKLIEILQGIHWLSANSNNPAEALYNRLYVIFQNLSTKNWFNFFFPTAYKCHIFYEYWCGGINDFARQMAQHSSSCCLQSLEMQHTKAGYHLWKDRQLGLQNLSRNCSLRCLHKAHTWWSILFLSS